MELFLVWPGGSGSTNDWLDHSFSLVGNWIYGGRYGQLGGNYFNNQTTNNAFTPQRVHFNGNSVELYPAINAVFGWDYPGAAVAGDWLDFLNASGNTLVTGGHGVHWQNNGTNALVLKNDFAAASYRALSVTSTNAEMLGVGVARNILNQGSVSHLRMRSEDASAWHLQKNSYRMNGSTNNLNPFIEPPGSSAHFFH